MDFTRLQEPLSVVDFPTIDLALSAYDHGARQPHRTLKRSSRPHDRRRWDFMREIELMFGGPTTTIWRSGRSLAFIGELSDMDVWKDVRWKISISWLRIFRFN